MDEKTDEHMIRRSFDIKTLDRHYVDDLAISSEEVLPIELGRGCQFKCSFCRFPLIGKKKGTYIRDMDLVERELTENYQRFGTTRYAIIDGTVNESEEKIAALADIADRLPFKLEWVGYNRVDLIAARPNMVETLKRSGLRSAFFGIESFHPHASLSVGKGWIGKHGQDFLLRLRDMWKDEITYHLSFIVGLPGEDESSIDATHKWCMDNKMYSWQFCALGIHDSPTERHQWVSTFDTEYAKYGYKFLDPDAPWKWHNEHWTFAQAVEKASVLRTEAYKHAKFACWSLSEAACALGKSFDSLMHMYLNEVPDTIINAGTKTLVDQYVISQLAMQ